MAPLDQVERSVARLDEATSVTGREFSTLRAVADWLRRNAPADGDRTLVHGDFRPGNVLFAGRDAPAVSGVLDWETAMLGDPRTELGYLLLRWRDDGDPTPSVDALDAKYDDEDAIRDLRETNETGLAPFTNRPGSPTRRELVARYEDATGASFGHDRFYRAHAALMLGAVWADLHRRQVAEGAGSSWAPYVDYVAMLGDSIAGGDFGL